MTELLSSKGLLRHRAYAAIFLFVLSFAVFSPSLRSDFVWDDFGEIKGKESSLTFSEIIPRAKRSGSKYHYRPMLFSSFVVDYSVWGISPFGFHLSNVLFHSINTVLLFYFVLLLLNVFKINGSTSIALLTSVFFAIFPLHIESVSFISARADLICCLFFLTALIFHILSFRAFWFFILASISFFLSVLSKEVAIVFPVLVLFFDLIAKRFSSPSNLIRYGVYTISIVAYLYERFGVYLFILRKKITVDLSVPGITMAHAKQLAVSLTGPPINGSTPDSQNELLNQVVHLASNGLEIFTIVMNSYLFYIGKLIFPFDLNPFIARVPAGSYYFVSSLIIISFLVAICIRSTVKGSSVIAFCIFWVLISLGLPVLLSISSVTATPLAERFLYIPSVGFCLLIGYLFVEWLRISKYKNLIWGLIFILSVFYSIFTVYGQRTWKDNVTFWGSVAKRSPDENVPHVNYGSALMRAGRNAEAIEQFLFVVDPDTKNKKAGKTAAAHNLGTLYLESGDLENAERWFRKAYDFNPKYEAKYNYYMALVLYSKGMIKYRSRDESREDYIEDFEQARDFLIKVLKRTNNDGRLHLMLAKTYLILGKNDLARQHAAEAIESGKLDKRSKREAQKIQLGK